MIVVGHFDSVNGINSRGIARINLDGSLDEGFSSNVGNGINGVGLDVLVLSDDSILVGGTFNNYNGAGSVPYFLKLNSDGTLNSTFTTNVYDSSAINGYVHAIALDKDGKILIGGNFNKKIRRFNADGTLDTAFDSGTGFNNRVTCIKPLASGQIYVSGWFTSYKGSSCNWRIVRLNEDGTLDGAFQGETVGLNSPDGSVMTMVVQSDGKVVLGGWFNAYNDQQQNLLIRFNSDGTKDASFDVDHAFYCLNYDYSPRIMHLAIDASGKIYAAHSEYFFKGHRCYGFSIINPDGSYVSSDPALNTNPNTYTDDYPISNAICKTLEGHFFIAGDSGRTDHDNMLRMVDAYGNDVSGFKSVKADGMIRDVQLQSTGKIIIIGNFEIVNGYHSKYICRLNPDGTVDGSFYNATHAVHPNNLILALRVRPDDSILVGSTFYTYGNTESPYFIGLTPDGEIDIVSDLNLNSHVHCITESNDGKIYIGGRFTNKIKRLNSDCTYDSSFNVGTGFSDGVGYNPRVSSIALQNDGKVVVGHWFATYNGVTTNAGITRLNANGSIDSSFTTNPLGLSDSNNRGIVNHVSIQSDGKILAAGWFNTYGGQSQRGLIRFNSDGSKDTGFDIGYGISATYPDYNGSRIQSLLLDQGKIYAAGTISWYHDRAKHYAIRINGDGSLDDSFNVSLPFDVASISDGGKDMYDGGNMICTNLLAPFYAIKTSNMMEGYGIPYTHIPNVYYGFVDAPYSIGNDLYDYNPVPKGTIQPADKYFGQGSHYFTNMYNGMFVLVATDISINDFMIAGNVGSDGNATVTLNSFNIQVDGVTYGVHLKTNADNINYDPSINHLIIHPGSISGVLNATSNYEGNDDDQRVYGFTASEIYYLILSKFPTAPLDEETARAVAIKFIEVIKG